MTGHRPSPVTRYRRHRLNSFERRRDVLDSRMHRWRTLRHRRTLVLLFCGIYLAGVALGVVAVLHEQATLLALTAALSLAACVLWVMIRTLIRMEDMAPPEFLDEYELARQLRLRAATTHFYYAIGLVYAGIITFGSVWALDRGWAMRDLYDLTYTTGMTMFLIIGLIGAIPGLVLAWTLPDPTDPDLLLPDTD
ncbi:hypothetical protein [Corynebacterium pygosceleis]|uniref:hypothetical protein n=1 Tax=Corynebacterium pygosceleis TaxID=2800406 RepID=UPI0019081A3B|nr:hypothetical protein [Corynebacterium pygosceleis]MCK7675885.1 hypothetical protein [Corynebacterium pygosceleis]MCL0120733.1 hypothetical protein [Corynebacterium pygosceleis]